MMRALDTNASRHLGGPPHGLGHERIYPWLVLLLLALWSAQAHATPQFAREYGLSCASCHLVPPKLNADGEAFLARGYRSDFGAGAARSTVPLSIWLTARQEEQVDRDFSAFYLNRVELISGGAIRDLPLSYFVEWRMVSQETRSDGSLRDRSGRFEDALINFELHEDVTITAGQFRALGQVDVSRRLSLSEPVIFSSSLPGDPASDPRITSLRSFSPSGRSPGFAFTYRSLAEDSPSDGLFHRLVLPFVGEFSIPLTDEARDEASFELEGHLKGVFLETYYRQGLNSVGVHAFIDDDRWLINAVGTMNFRDLYFTAGVGVDDREGADWRLRYSIEAEYLPQWSAQWRPGVGFRVEQITHADRQPAYIPYFVLSVPNKDYTLLIQVEYRAQQDADAFFLDVSLLF